MNQRQIDAVGEDLPGYNFGALKVPSGYLVFYNGTHYQGCAPDGTCSPQHWSPFACMAWCKQHAAEDTPW